MRNKKLIAVLIMVTLLMTLVPATAFAGPYKAKYTHSQITTKPIIFEDTIRVTERGGDFRVGFVTLRFKKGFLPKDQLPAVFKVKVCAKDGKVGIDVNPDTEKFLKNVQIKVDRYNGLLYDQNKGKNVYVSVKPQMIIAWHFSWYRFR